MSKRRLSNYVSPILEDDDIENNENNENTNIMNKSVSIILPEISNIKKPLKNITNNIKSRLSILPKESNNINNNGGGKFIKRMDNNQISELYSQCIQLSTNNKINMANSWQLPLIDYIDDVLKNDDLNNDETNFQKASCTLDASVKIYSYRVDSVHQTTFKVLGGLNRTDNNNEIDENEINDDDNENESDLKKVKAQKRIKFKYDIVIYNN